MVMCDDARDELALDPAAADSAIQHHLQGCAACASYYRRHAALDGIMRAELHWEVPSDLSARLLALVAPAAPQLIRTPPKRWHVVAAWIATTLSILLSLVIGWQLITLLMAQVDLAAALASLLALPSQALAYLTQQLPESRYAVDFFLRVRTQLVWLLAVALVWAVLDKWNPRFAFRRQQRA